MRSTRPIEDCIARLAAVTSHQGHRLFLATDRETADVPVLRGRVTRQRAVVASFAETLGMGSGVAYLYAGFRTLAGGETEIYGKIGFSRRVSLNMIKLAFANVVILIPAFVVGLRGLSSSSLSTGAVFTVAPILMWAFELLFVRALIRDRQTSAQRLITTISKLTA